MRDSYGSYLMEDSNVADRSMNIIIDFGLKFSKVGYAGEIEPRKIIKTPSVFEYNEFLNECIKKKMQLFSEEVKDEPEKIKFNECFKNIMSYFRTDYEKIRLELEEFFHNIVYNVLQIQKLKNNKLYSVVFLIDPFIPKMDKIYEIMIKIILENPNFQAVKLFPKNITPIYTTGFSSGIIIDLGVVTSNIIPINEGFPYIDMIDEIGLSYIDLEREFKLMIIEDNVTNPINPKIGKVKNLDFFSESLNPGLDDLLTRSMFCANRKISELLKNPVEFSKLKNEINKIDHNDGSFYSNMARRVTIGTKFFGDFNDEELNFAYSLLKLIKKLPCEDRKKLSSNIILNGGLTMTFGFYKRMVEEIQYILDLNKEPESEFYELQGIRNDIKIHKILFPRNNLSWIGCSILFNLDSVNIKHLTITRDDIEGEVKINEPRKTEDEFLRRASGRMGSLSSFSSTAFRVPFKKYEINKEITLLKTILNYYRINK